MFAIISVLLFLVWLHQYLSRHKFSQLPSPGLCLPIVGHYQYLLYMINYAHCPSTAISILFNKFSRNKLLLLNVLGVDTVYVGDANLLRELYNNPAVQNRDHENFHQSKAHVRRMGSERQVKAGYMPGIIFSQGKVWTEQRRFTIKTLRDFGFGKSSMEELIRNEVKKFTDYLQDFVGVPLDMSHTFNLPILNALWFILVGETFQYKDSKLLDISHKCLEYIYRMGTPSGLLAMSYPWIYRLFPNLLNRQEDVQLMREMLVFMRERVEEHRETLDMDNPRDYIDKMLIEINNTTDMESSFYGEKGYENLLNNVLDLFLAGMESSAKTMTWTMLYMVREPTVQRKVQAEIDAVVGDMRQPCMADKEKMHYTLAVIQEVQRMANVAPPGVPHFSSQPITVAGITIPANTAISPLFNEILHGDHWSNGKTFQPERFLDAEGNVKKEDNFIPFCVGKRHCPGETLAKTEIFLFFTGILQLYNITHEVEGDVPSEEPVGGVTVGPKTFRVILQPRI